MEFVLYIVENDKMMKSLINSSYSQHNSDEIEFVKIDNTCEETDTSDESFNFPLPKFQIRA